MTGLVKFIKYGLGRYAIVDAKDFERLSVYTWGKHSQGYAIRCRPNGKGRKLFMHRDVLPPAPGQQTDHIDGDVSDNRKENLRLCNNKQNSQNRKLQRNNTSGFKGVSRQGNKWRASIYPNDLHINLGSFGSKEAAARAYDAAAKKYYGDYAKLNFND